MLYTLVAALPLAALFALITLAIFLVVKGADLLVNEAVAIAVRHGIPTILVGATIVSLGTTLPEVAVSSAAAIAGTSDVAMGNAVGSIICNFGLILGTTILISPPRVDRTTMNPYGRIQLGSMVILVATVLLFRTSDGGGRIPRTIGFLYIALLALYLLTAVAWAKRGRPLTLKEVSLPSGGKALLSAVRMASGVVLVVGASRLLVPAVQETALRVGVPEGIVAATMVAFGTSVPELVTALTAAAKGHGELAIGNVIGANTLNVLFVIGASAAILPAGLMVSPYTVSFLIPVALALTILMRLGILLSTQHLSRWLGAVLLGSYAVATVIAYIG